MRAELIDSMGSDLSVVNAARVSFDKESEWVEIKDEFSGQYMGRVLAEKDEKLINYLARHNHFTPFTHPQITLRETVPIFVARQRFKHVVGFTYNEVSRRYVDDDPEFYIPDVWRSRPEGGVKQGSGEKDLSHAVLDSVLQVRDGYTMLIEHSESLYKEMLKVGVAPEQARMVLPQSMMTSYYVTGSLAAFARAYNLRKDSHAQKEIQDLAAQWKTIIEPLFPVSWRALCESV